MWVNTCVIGSKTDVWKFSEQHRQQPLAVMFVDLVFCSVSDAAFKWFIDSVDDVNGNNMNNNNKIIIMMMMTICRLY